MTAEIDRLLTRYESGEISRPELLRALTASTTAAPVASGAEPAVGTITALNHVTVFVEDVRMSVEFYQRLFGMPVLTRQGAGVNLRAGAGFLGLYPRREDRLVSTTLASASKASPPTPSSTSWRLPA